MIVSPFFPPHYLFMRTISRLYVGFFSIKKSYYIKKYEDNKAEYSDI
nr:MAG TPA: hypothetical protein [Caudoviricetes sp.]